MSAKASATSKPLARLLIGVARLAIHDAANARKERVESLFAGERALALLERALRVSPHQQHTGAGLAHSIDALLLAYAHDALTHADGTKGLVAAIAAHEHDDPLTKAEGRLTLHAHAELTELAAEGLDHHLALAGGGAANVLFHLDAVQGPDRSVRALKRLGKHDFSEEDLVCLADELIQIQSLDDGRICGAGPQSHGQDAHKNGERLDSKHRY